MLNRIKKNIAADKKMSILLNIVNDSYKSDPLIRDYIKLELSKVSDMSYEEFEQKVLIPILSKKFECEEELIETPKPNGYGKYIMINKSHKEANKAYTSIINAFNSEDVSIKDILLYVTGKTDVLNINMTQSQRRVVEEKRYALSVYRDYLNVNNNEITITESNDFNIGECKEYANEIERIQKLKSIVYSTINKFIRRDIEISGEEISKEMESSKYSLPLSDKYYSVRKINLSLDDISALFGSFDLKHYIDSEQNNEPIEKLLYDNKKAIRVLLAMHDKDYISSLGFSLAHTDRLFKIAKYFDMDEESLELSDLKIIADSILVDLSPYEYGMNKNIIGKVILYDIYSYEKDTNVIMAKAGNLVESAMYRRSSTIPIINSENYETLDYRNPEVLVSGINTDSCFKIGGNGNDLLHYCLLDKNGVIIYLRDNNGNIVGRVAGIRRGNGLFLHQLQKIVDADVSRKELTDLVTIYANDIISASSKSNEPIEFVSITDCAGFKGNDEKNPIVTKDKCDYIDSPFDTETDDFKTFVKTDGLYLKTDYACPFYNNYSEHPSRIISSCVPYDKLNVVSYDASDIYIRTRNHFTCFDLTNTEECNLARQKMCELIYLNNRKTMDRNEAMSNIEFNMSEYEYIICGEDWVVATKYDGTHVILNLDCDDRSISELEEAKNELGIKEVNNGSFSKKL